MEDTPPATNSDPSRIGVNGSLKKNRSPKLNL